MPSSPFPRASNAMTCSQREHDLADCNYSLFAGQRALWECDAGPGVLVAYQAVIVGKQPIKLLERAIDPHQRTLHQATADGRRCQKQLTVIVDTVMSLDSLQDDNF